MIAKRLSALLLVALPLATLAQRPADVPICDYYTTALLNNNSAASQYQVLTLLVNTVVIGNYTQPNVGIAVPGILATGEFNGEQVNLLPYFNGCLNTSNSKGNVVNRNFLDGGGAAALLLNLPAFDTASQQAGLLKALYSFFGRLLGCSGYGTDGFPAYARRASMAEVHRFMSLNTAQVGYFIQQVGLAAASFGVAEDDVEAVGCALASTFGFRCSPPTNVLLAEPPAASSGPQLNSICQDITCKVDPVGGVCELYLNPGGQGVSPEPAENTPGCRGPI